MDFQHGADGKINRLASAGVDTTVRVSFKPVCFGFVARAEHEMACYPWYETIGPYLTLVADGLGKEREIDCTAIHGMTVPLAYCPSVVLLSVEMFSLENYLHCLLGDIPEWELLI